MARFECDDCGRTSSGEAFCCRCVDVSGCDCVHPDDALRRWIDTNRSSITSIERDLLLAVAENMANAGRIFVAP